MLLHSFSRALSPKYFWLAFYVYEDFLLFFQVKFLISLLFYGRPPRIVYANQKLSLSSSILQPIAF